MFALVLSNGCWLIGNYYRNPQAGFSRIHILVGSNGKDFYKFIYGIMSGSTVSRLYVRRRDQCIPNVILSFRLFAAHEAWESRLGFAGLH